MLTIIIANFSVVKIKTLYNSIYVHMVMAVELCCIFDIASSYCLMHPHSNSLYNIFVYVVTLGFYGTQMFGVTYLTMYFYAYIRHDLLSKKDMLIICIPTIIGELLVLSNPITGFAFTITDGVFKRGPLISVLYIMIGVYLVWASVVMLKNWNDVRTDLKLVYYVYIIIAIVSTSIQYYMPEYLVECSGMTILLLVIHYSVQNTNMLEEAVKKEREIAEVAERTNELKARFIAQISHDIRTPMNAIIGMSSIAKEELEDREQAMQCLDTVLTSAQHLMALINNIIELNDMNNDKVIIDPKPVIMKNEIEVLAAMMRPQFEEKNQVFEIRFAGEEKYYVMADVLRIDQILIKIISNASNYMEAGKKAVLDVSFSELDNGNIQYIFDIVDEGMGMKQEFLDHLFETFHREHTSTESGIEGFGLGLAIVKRLVDAMNADIDVESVMGKGTRFSLRFSFAKGGRIVNNKPEDGNEPGNAAGVTQEQGLNAPAVIEEDDKLRMKGILSLIVEDNEVNIRILSRALRRNGSAVLVAKNGVEAVEKVKKIGFDRIGVIFMDLQMPVMDGFEATKIIRDMEKEVHCRHIPIYAVTANTAMEDCNAAFEAGVDGIFAKPVHFQEFFETLANDGIVKKA